MHILAFFFFVFAEIIYFLLLLIFFEVTFNSDLLNSDYGEH